MFKQISIIAQLAVCLAMVVTEAAAQGGMGGFGGPAVLGRSPGSSTGQRGIADIGIRFYAGLNAIADSGLTGASLDSNGTVSSSTSQGAEGVAGVYGTRRFRRGTIGVNYQGGYRYYRKSQGFNGADQNFAIFASRQFDAHSAMAFNASIGTTNRALGIPLLQGIVDSSFSSLALPNNELFDNRLYYGNSSINYIIQKSARTSFHMQGSGFITRRTGDVLYGLNGASSTADVAYRLSRRQTISIGYQFFFYNFTRNFGDSIGNGAYGSYSVQLGRRMQLAVRGGFYRMEVLALRTAQVDPIIAALIGQTSTSEVFFNKSILPTGSFVLNGPITRRSTFSVSGGLFVSPGNGIINTSRNYNVSTGYNYTGIRTWTLGANAAYNLLGSVAGDYQTFSSGNFGGSASRRVGRSLYFTAGAGFRKYFRSTTNSFQRDAFYTSLGLYYSPGELPLAIR